MLDSDQILAAIRALRPLLKELVGDQAEPIDQIFAEYITCAEQGEPATNQILTLLSQHEILNDWVNRYIKNQSETRLGARKYQPVPGSGPMPIPASMYICPCDDCDYSWFRESISQPVTLCPRHGVRLIPANNRINTIA